MNLRGILFCAFTGTALLAGSVAPFGEAALAHNGNGGAGGGGGHGGRAGSGMSAGSQASHSDGDRDAGHQGRSSCGGANGQYTGPGSSYTGC
jgi:hypothetical protein